MLRITGDVVIRTRNPNGRLTATGWLVLIAVIGFGLSSLYEALWVTAK